MLSTLMICTSILHAQNVTPSFEPDDSISWIHEDTEDLPVSFFGQVDIDYDYIFPSTIKQSEFDNQGVAFSEGNVNLSGTRLLSRDMGYNVGIGYTKTGLFWDQNPFFNQENFDTLNFSVNGFTKCWRT